MISLDGDTRGMNVSFNVRQAVSEANAVFRRFPVRISLPMVLLGVVGYAVVAVQPVKFRFWITVPILFVTLSLNWFFEVVISSMYLRARGGDQPSARQVGEVLRYRGLASLMGGLFLRCLGWILIVSVVLFFAAVIGFAIVHAAMGIGAASLTGRLGHGVVSGFQAILGIAVFRWCCIGTCSYSRCLRSRGFPSLSF
jgi:hypothetical protein